jgi:hypothetical protein
MINIESLVESQSRSLAFDSQLDFSVLTTQDIPTFFSGLSTTEPPDLLQDDNVNTSQTVTVPLNSGGASTTIKGVGGAWGGYQNGLIPLQAMVVVGRRGDNRYGGKHYLMPEAAAAWQKLYAQAKADGHHLQLSSAYRDRVHQASLGKGKYVAAPGKSRHGWGRAVDIGQLFTQDRSISNTARIRRTPLYIYLDRVGRQHGFYNPAALRDGRGVEEPWHWEHWGVSQ